MERSTSLTRYLMVAITSDDLRRVTCIEAIDHSGSKDALRFIRRQLCHVDQITRLALLADIAHALDQMVGENTRQYARAEEWYAMQHWIELDCLQELDHPGV